MNHEGSQPPQISGREDTYAERAREALHVNAYDYFQQLFGADPNLTLMSQADADAVFHSTIPVLQGDFVPRNDRDIAAGLLFIRGATYEEIGVRFGMALPHKQARRIVRRLLHNLRMSYEDQHGRQPALADFWQPAEGTSPRASVVSSYEDEEDQETRAQREAAEQERLQLQMAREVRETGNREVLNTLVEQYYPSLLEYAYRLHRSAGLAPTLSGMGPEDAAQNTVDRVLRAIARAEKEERRRPLPALPYFIVTMKSVYSDFFKQFATRKIVAVGGSVAAEEQSPQSDAAEELLEQQRQAQIHTALRVIVDNLTEEQRPIALDMWMGMTAAEIAVKYGTSEIAVKGRVYRARRIARELAERGDIILPDDF